MTEPLWEPPTQAVPEAFRKSKISSFKFSEITIQLKEFQANTEVSVMKGSSGHDSGHYEWEITFFCRRNHIFPLASILLKHMKVSFFRLFGVELSFKETLKVWKLKFRLLSTFSNLRNNITDGSILSIVEYKKKCSWDGWTKVTESYKKAV